MNATEVFQQTARRIADKVARFEKLLRDPDLAPYVSALRNGDLPQPTAAPVSPTAAPVPQRAAASKAGIRNAIRSLKSRLPREFTAEHVARELKRTDFAVGAKNADKAIRNTLFKLSQKKEVKRVKAGSKGKSNTYAFVKK